MADTDYKKNSILQTVKDGLLIVDTFEAFDNRIIGIINTVIAELAQVGYPPAKNFEVTGYNETWDNLIPEPGYNLVRTFITEKVALIFDPPTSSYAYEMKKSYCEELEVRINYKVETGDAV